MDERFNLILIKPKKTKTETRQRKQSTLIYPPHSYPQGFRERETGRKIKTWLRERWRIDRMIETLI